MMTTGDGGGKNQRRAGCGRKDAVAPMVYSVLLNWYDKTRARVQLTHSQSIIDKYKQNVPNYKVQT